MLAVEDNDLKRLLEANNAELLGRFDSSVEGLKKSGEETRRHFDVTAERLENKIQLIAETLANLDEKHERRFDEIGERMERGFAETQAMIKFSHAELDRRVRLLENGLAELQARVDRLETSTH